jgi:uncharacterized protein (UPF0332 family)
VSPRSAEFLAQARGRLAAARRELAAGDPATSASLAYYGLLYAARAALSEEGVYAKTHRESWDAFWRTFAATGRFDAALASRAREVQELRELADCEARRPTIAEAQRVLEVTDRFVAAVDALIGA